MSTATSINLGEIGMDENPHTLMLPKWEHITMVHSLFLKRKSVVSHANDAEKKDPHHAHKSDVDIHVSF
jgi:hypothetical protein